MNDSYSKDRRNYLKTIVIAGGAAALLATAKKGDAAKLTQPPLDKDAQGYRETEHVKRYYQTARN